VKDGSVDGEVLLESNAREGDSPLSRFRCVSDYHTLSKESGSLGVEPKVSGRSPRRLNIRSETDSKQVL